MKMTKQIACAVLAAACVAGFSGCGSKSYSKPKVAEGAVIALAGHDIKSTSLASLAEKYKLGTFTEENMAKVPAEMKDLVKELALDKVETKWFALTVGDVSGVMKEEVPDIAFAAATTLDLDKTVAACEKKLKEDKSADKPEIKKTTVAGVPAYEIRAKDFKTGGKEVVPCAASLDGQLIIVASSAAVLEKQIALYKDGKGESADFASFKLGANDILRAKIVKVGENIKKSLPSPDALQIVNGIVPDGDKVVLGLNYVELAFGASADGKNVTLDLTVDTAADADADKLRSYAKTGLMALTAQMQQNAEKDADAKMAYDALKAAKVEGEGKVAKLSSTAAAEPILKALADLAK